MAPDFPCGQNQKLWLLHTALHAMVAEAEAQHPSDAGSQAHLGHEEGAAVVEDLRVVGTLGQRVQPHADRLLSVPVPDVKVGQRVSQRARLRAQLQQRLTQSNAVVKPAATGQTGRGGHPGV